MQSAHGIMASAGLGALLGLGCTDKAVALDVQVPPAAQAAAFDTSCVRAVEVYLNGGNYPTDDEDYVRSCVDVTTPAATFSQLRDRLAGQIDVQLPASGLSGVELWGYAGSCDAARPEDFDLITYGSGAHIGGDQITIPLVPNLDCAPVDVTIRPIDVLKLVALGCPMAGWTDGRLALSTLSPFPFTDETTWWGGASAAIVTGGVVNVRGNVEVGPRSCLAVGLYTDGWNGVTCVPPADQRACATGTELEAPMVDLDVWTASLDGTKYSEYGGLIIGAVHDGAPVANATVTLDEADRDKGEVVYLDMPAGVEDGIGALTPRGGTSTGPSGLFGIYTQSFVRVTITANGRSVTRTIGGNEDSMTAVVVRP